MARDPEDELRVSAQAKRYETKRERRACVECGLVRSVLVHRWRSATEGGTDDEFFPKRCGICSDLFRAFELELQAKRLRARAAAARARRDARAARAAKVGS